jgi:hypothetical protein
LYLRVQLRWSFVPARKYPGQSPDIHQRECWWTIAKGDGFLL